MLIPRPPFFLCSLCVTLLSREQIELTEEEQDAVDTATLLYDSTPALQALTEKGTVGEVREEQSGWRRFHTTGANPCFRDIVVHVSRQSRPEEGTLPDFLDCSEWN